ncbi:YfjI family protein [Photobacterium carnosum]|uniref:hypothetical protein n=1 Tax=Photobacterium carnosum TaxID=2023717 RepID=UPI00128C34A9|nr:hypothetical protein [Photobacterium carnosum]KAE8175602.1 hypothetical protein CIT27_17565 [Photobacterium carnosum]
MNNKHNLLTTEAGYSEIPLVNAMGLACRPFSSNHGFSLTELPDFAGDITKDSLGMQRRPQPRLACLSALHLLSLAANKTLTPTGLKLNLMSIVIGETASGKDAPQLYTSDTAAHIGLGRNVLDKISTDKDFIINLLDNDFKTFYINDEAHAFFDGIDNKNSSLYVRNIGSLILSAYTGEALKLNGIRQRELKADAKDEKKRITKKYKELGAEPEGERRCQELDDQLNELFEYGIRNPYFSLMATSTPSEIDGFVNERTLNSGQLGRTLIVRADPSGELRDGELPQISQEIITKLRDINKCSKGKVTATEEASMYMTEIRKHYDLPEIRNHGVFGAIYRRMFEMVSKIASILAVGNNFTMTLEHVIWAHEFAYLSLADIVDTYHANKVSNSSSNLDIYYSTMQRIVTVIGKEKRGITKGVLVQGLSQSSKKKVPFRSLLEKYAERTWQNEKDLLNGFVLKIIDNMTVHGIINCGGKITVEDKDKLLNVSECPEWFNQWLLMFTTVTNQSPMIKRVR